jgi:predicted lipoprotein
MGLASSLLIAIITLFACSSAGTVSTQEVLIGLTDQVIVPQFQSVASEMNDLKGSLDELCDDPSLENLENARDGWRSARASWMRSQAMSFGPVMDRRSRSLVDWSPIDPARIEEILSERDSVTDEYVREFLSSPQRGLGAIEYVLFKNDKDVLELPGRTDSIHCQYLAALGDVASDEMNAVLLDWTGSEPESVAYAAKFNGTASNSLIGKAAISEVVRTTIFLNRSITNMKLGKALGLSDGKTDPTAISGGAGQHAVADIRNQVLGMQDIYVGANTGDDAGLGLGALIRGLSSDSDQWVRASFTNALESIDKLEEPLQITIVQNPEPAQEAHESLMELQRVLNTEVVSLLGVSVGFADTDGDGG